MSHRFCTHFSTLRKKIITCRLCPRLVEFRENVPKRTSFKEEEYWRRPVSGFGDTEGWLLITGLAPAAHGGNRTGRIFTGDLSAKFLMNALYKAGFANQPTSERVGDGLQLLGCYMTAAVKCVPPDNAPLRIEFESCSQYYANELLLLKNLKAILALGKEAFESYLRFVGERKPFIHGKCYLFEKWPRVYASYHPSPQNTYTGKLTDKMFLSFLEKIKKDYTLTVED